jgi:arsenite methyltransferase
MTMRRCSAWAFAAALAASSAAYAQAQDPATRREHGAHTDVDAYIRMLDSAARDGYQKPDEVVAALALKPGDAVADVGAGSGYFTLRFARAVGAAGRVYAVDVEPRMVEHIRQRAAEAGLTNVTATLAPPDDPRLPEHKIDLVFFCDVWHHVEKQAAYIAALRNSLAPAGRIVMIDYQKRPLPVGPGMDTKIAREDVVRQMQENGFRLAGEHTFLPYQYFLVFTAAQ